MALENQSILFCTRVKAGPAPLRRTRVSTCRDCGEEIYLSALSDDLLFDTIAAEKSPIIPVCLPCGRKRLDEDEDEETSFGLGMRGSPIGTTESYKMKQFIDRAIQIEDQHIKGAI